MLPVAYYLSDSEQPSVPKLVAPPKGSCLGCRTFFIESEHLDLENIHVEFKNYTEIPLKEMKHKFIILKTIIAFLNTKGGAIYMGVEDQMCSIVGNLISKSRQAEFAAFVVDLCKEIYPAVDTKNGEVKTLFIPVMKRSGAFTGKYVTKILVQQGKIDTLYTFAQKIKLRSQNPLQCEDFEIRMGFVRIGPGGVQKLTGLKLYEEVYQRAKQPHEVFRTHVGCHPQPKEVSLDISTIGFRVQKGQLAELSRQLARLTHEMGKIEYKQRYDQGRKVSFLEFQNSAEAELIRDCIPHNILQGNSGPKARYEGIQNQAFMFSYLPPATNMHYQTQKQHSTPHLRKSLQIVQKLSRDKWSKVESLPKELDHLNERDKQKHNPKGDLLYIFTHINIKRKRQFFTFLQNVLSNKFKLIQYYNSALVQLNSQADFDSIKKIVKKTEPQLHSFGHSGVIIFGRPTGHIHVYNYFQKLKEKLKDLIVSKYLVDSVVKFSFRPDNNDSHRTYADVEVEPKDVAESLDILLRSEEIWECKMYTKGKETQPKIKFMLQCD